MTPNPVAPLRWSLAPLVIALALVSACASAPKSGQSTSQAAVRVYVTEVAEGDAESASAVSLAELNSSDLQGIRMMLFSDATTFTVSSVICADEGAVVDSPRGQRTLMPIESVVSADGSVKLDGEEEWVEASVAMQEDGTWLVEGFFEQQ